MLHLACAINSYTELIIHLLIYSEGFVISDCHIKLHYKIRYTNGYATCFGRKDVSCFVVYCISHCQNFGLNYE